jgi:hypothetical protein
MIERVPRAAMAVFATLQVATWGATPRSAEAADAVGVAVLQENGVGTSAQAQPHLDALLQIAAAENGWSAATGKYFTSRKLATAYLDEQKPHYAILSVGAFLAWEKSRSLTVIGQVEVTKAGGREYHVVTKTAGDLGACKGKALATNHGGDPKFIDKVVAGGAFSLGDFQLVTTTRPIQTLKKVIDGEVACALVDDAQVAAMSSVDGGTSLRSVWKSAALPHMPIVAFPDAPAGERAAFKASLGKLCAGGGQPVCERVGIQSIKPGDASTYAGVVAAYAK